MFVQSKDYRQTILMISHSYFSIWIQESEIISPILFYTAIMCVLVNVTRSTSTNKSPKIRDQWLNIKGLLRCAFIIVELNILLELNNKQRVVSNGLYNLFNFLLINQNYTLVYLFTKVNLFIWYIYYLSQTSILFK